jgi:hypothetical protein
MLGDVYRWVGIALLTLVVILILISFGVFTSENPRFKKLLIYAPFIAFALSFLGLESINIGEHFNNRNSCNKGIEMPNQELPKDDPLRLKFEEHIQKIVYKKDSNILFITRFIERYGEKDAFGESNGDKIGKYKNVGTHFLWEGYQLGYADGLFKTTEV